MRGSSAGIGPEAMAVLSFMGWLTSAGQRLAELSGGLQRRNGVGRVDTYCGCRHLDPEGRPTLDMYLDITDAGGWITSWLLYAHLADGEWCVEAWVAADVGTGGQTTIQRFEDRRATSVQGFIAELNSALSEIGSSVMARLGNA